MGSHHFKALMARCFNENPSFHLRMMRNKCRFSLEDQSATLMPPFLELFVPICPFLYYSHLASGLGTL